MNSFLKDLKNIFCKKRGLNAGEDLAARYLKKHGHKIVYKNYHEKCGEIDIISLHKNVLVFSEVKQRKSDRFGRPEDFVTKQKRDRIKRTAQLYIMRKKYKGIVRFDVVEILGDVNPKINHIQNAF